MNEYLLGIVAECECELEHLDAERGDDVQRNRDSTADASSRYRERMRCAAQRVLDQYNGLLAVRPNSYWGNYRAAAVAFGLGGISNIAKSAGHLEECLKQRPKNPVLRGQLATCLMELNQNGEAFEESAKAIKSAPDLAELYRTRAFIRTALGPTDGLGLAEDIQHYEILSHVLPCAILSDRRTGPNLSSWLNTRANSQLPLWWDFGTLAGEPRPEPYGDRRSVEPDPEELTARAELASRVAATGELELAVSELRKILFLEPDQIDVRMSCAIVSIERHRYEAAQRDLDAVLANPRLIPHLQKHPTFIQRFHHASRRYCLYGRLPEGRAIAHRALDLAIALGLPTGESRYNVAWACAMSSRTDPQFIVEAAEQLYQLFVTNPLNQGSYASDPAFEPVRNQIDAELREKPDPTKMHHKGLSTGLARAD